MQAYLTFQAGPMETGTGGNLETRRGKGKGWGERPPGTSCILRLAS